MATHSPACLTRTGNISDDQNHDQDNFGYCPDNCAGEMPGPSSPYNLATSKHRQFWYSHIYDLSSYENGYCHTFNPPHKSIPGLENRMYFMINNITWLYSRTYDLFLHERGQFWPRLDMFSLGQSDPVKLELNSDVEVIFTLNKISTINSKRRPCIEGNNYSFTECVQNFAVKETKCNIGYFEVNKDQELCSRENFFQYFKLLIWIKHSRLSEVIEESGCYPKCKMSQYSFETIHKRSSWTSNWTAEVYIQPKSSIVEFSTEYYTFDGNDLLGNIGGNLGLFLGWSFLTFIEALSFVLCIVRFKVKNDY